MLVHGFILFECIGVLNSNLNLNSIRFELVLVELEKEKEKEKKPTRQPTRTQPSPRTSFPFPAAQLPPRPSPALRATHPLTARAPRSAPSSILLSSSQRQSSSAPLRPAPSLSVGHPEPVGSTGQPHPSSFLLEAASPEPGIAQGPLSAIRFLRADHGHDRRC